MIFSFSSEHTIIVVLLQKNDQGSEQPITFFIKALRDENFKYNIMEKQTYYPMKSLKYFTEYISKSQIIAYVLHILVKDMFFPTRSRWKEGEVDHRNLGIWHGDKTHEVD